MKQWQAYFCFWESWLWLYMFRHKLSVREPSKVQQCPMVARELGETARGAKRGGSGTPTTAVYGSPNAMGCNMLTNKTRCPDSLLLPLILHAQQAIGIKTAIAVLITQAHTERVTGYATRGLTVKVSLPKCRYDAIECAYRFWRVLLHEFGHIKDYGTSLPFVYYRAGRVNRMAHDTRPQEVRANQYVADVQERIARGELAGCGNDILALAVWLDS